MSTAGSRSRRRARVCRAAVDKRVLNAAVRSETGWRGDYGRVVQQEVGDARFTVALDDRDCWGGRRREGLHVALRDEVGRRST